MVSTWFFVQVKCDTSFVQVKCDSFLTFTTLFLRMSPHPPWHPPSQMSPKFWRMRCHIWPEQKIMLIPCFVMFVHPKTWKYGHYSKNQRFFGIIIGIWKSQNHPKWPKSRNFQVLACKNIEKHGINMIFCSGKMWHIIFQNFGDLCKGGVWA